MSTKTYPELVLAFNDMEEIVKWILQNQNIHPNNIKSAMQDFARKYSIEVKKPEEHGYFVLNLGVAN